MNHSFAGLVLELPGHWMDHSKCGDRQDDLFFPVGETPPAKRQEAHAKALCKVCPVTAECLAWSLETKQPFGIWGGLNEGERRRLRLRGDPGQRPRGRTGSPHGTVQRYTNARCRCKECAAAAAAHKRAWRAAKRKRKQGAA